MKLNIDFTIFYGDGADAYGSVDGVIERERIPLEGERISVLGDGVVLPEDLAHRINPERVRDLSRVRAGLPDVLFDGSLAMKRVSHVDGGAVISLEGVCVANEQDAQLLGKWLTEHSKLYVWPYNADEPDLD